jgi:hypothetical protein
MLWHDDCWYLLDRIMEGAPMTDDLKPESLAELLRGMIAVQMATLQMLIDNDVVSPAEAHAELCKVHDTLARVPDGGLKAACVVQQAISQIDRTYKNPRPQLPS